MSSFRYLLAPLAASLLLSGCVINSTRHLPTGGTPSPWRSVVVYGVRAPLDGVSLEQYDLKTQSITGNCFFWNRTEEVRPPGAASTPVRYVAFNVPAGSYILRYGGARVEEPTPTAYIAPAGRTVYIGDFLYTPDQAIALQRDLPAFEKARQQALPDLKGEVLLADSQAVKPPVMFLCTP